MLRKSDKNIIELKIFYAFEIIYFTFIYVQWRDNVRTHSTYLYFFRVN